MKEELWFSVDWKGNPARHLVGRTWGFHLFKSALDIGEANVMSQKTS
jgi:hypothetical protein